MSAVDPDISARVDRLVARNHRRTVGSAALHRALEHVTARDVAARVGATPSAVSRWAAAISRPAYRTRVVLAGVYGIGVESWDLERTVKKEQGK